MYCYTIKINGLKNTFKQCQEEDYNIGEQIPLSEEGGQVIYDENNEEFIPATFPRPVYGIVVEKEKLTDS